MRLISQDGMIDVLYEYGSLSVGVGKVEEIEYAVIKYHNVSSPNGTKLAEYNSKSKAIKVMEMLRNAYVGLLIIMQNVEVEDEVIEKLKGTNVVLANIPNEKSNIEYINNGYFKFPADEEVEV